MTADMTIEHFEPLQGQEFTVTSTDPAQALRLVEVARKGNGERSGGAFSLLWQSSTGTILPQGIYRMHSAGMDAFDIFIVPIGASESSVRYEAIFT